MSGSYEENMQKVLDLRSKVLDVNQPNPTAEEVFEAVQALHQTRGVAAAKKKEAKPIIDLASIFKPTEPEKVEEKTDATQL
jgi:hypothetical protein